jgi:lambda family phage portal protein
MPNYGPSGELDAGVVIAAPPRRPLPGSSGARMYAGARNTRLTGGFGTSGSSSADAELRTSLPQLRSRSRQLMRDAPYAKRARVIVVNNVVGSGVGLQGQVKTTRDTLNDTINSAIEDAFNEWSCADSCHTGGALHFSDFERAALSEVFTAGECLIRLHFSPFGDSKVPLALELIEPERMADGFTTPDPGVAGNVDVRMGVEIDAFQRAVAYWIRDRHPGDLNWHPGETNRILRIPADQMLHLRIVDRWPQTRGEPWLHAVLRKLNDMEEYSGSELTAARMSANYFATIESPQEDPMPGAVKADDGNAQLNIEAGMIDQLLPGDKLEFHTPNRPNTALDPFMRYMLREVAAGVGTSYESISRDYSQSNYSSSRLALLDDRDLWQVLQQWWARSFRGPLHSIWLKQAVLSQAITQVPLGAYGISPKQFEAVRWKFRGWSWIDPTKEVEAYREAVRCGFTTNSSVIAMTAGGRDIEDILEERREELDAMKAKNLIFDTDPSIPATRPTSQSDQPAGAPPADTTPAATPAQDATPAAARVVSIAR